jgi:hypothetical protein
MLQQSPFLWSCKCRYPVANYPACIDSNPDINAHDACIKQATPVVSNTLAAAAAAAATAAAAPHARLLGLEQPLAVLQALLLLLQALGSPTRCPLPFGSFLPSSATKYFLLLLLLLLLPHCSRRSAAAAGPRQPLRCAPCP